MKRVTWIFLLSSLVTVLRANPDSLFQKANRLYENGAYEEALATYHSILDTGYVSPELYYNMGNAAFRSNDIGYAILYYEKALKLDPSFEDARKNLSFASQYKVDEFDPVPELFIKTWIKKAVESQSEMTWSLLSLLLFFLLLGGILIYVFTRRLWMKKTGFFTSLAAIILFAFTVYSSINRYREIKNPDEGIIVSPTVVVKSAPSDTGTELFILHEGTKVDISEQVSGWYNIRVIDGREGWIRDGEFKTI